MGRAVITRSCHSILAPVVLDTHRSTGHLSFNDVFYRQPLSNYRSNIKALWFMYCLRQRTRVYKPPFEMVDLYKVATTPYRGRHFLKEARGPTRGGLTNPWTGEGMVQLPIRMAHCD